MIFSKILEVLDKPVKDETFNYLLNNSKFTKTREWFALGLIFIFGIVITIILFGIKYKDYVPPAIYQISEQTLKNNNYKEQLITLSKPRITKKALQAWSIDTINNMYNFDFNNFDEQLKSSRKYFTNDGYYEFKKSINNIGLRQTIVDKKQIISLTVSETPSIIGEMGGNRNRIDGKTYWKMQVPAVLTVSSGVVVYKNVLIQLLVVLENSNDNPSGIFIKDLRMN